MRRYATRTLLVAAFPGVETPGNHRISLREKRDWDLPLYWPPRCDLIDVTD